MLTFINSLLSQKYAENNVQSWTDWTFPSNLRTRCCAESVKLYKTTFHACFHDEQRRVRSETTRNHPTCTLLYPFSPQWSYLMFINQSLPRSYHFNVRKLLDRIHKLTHIRRNPWNPVNSSSHAERPWPRRSYFWHESRWDIRRWKFSVRIKCSSVMIFWQKISAPVLSRFINYLSCSNA